MMNFLRRLFSGDPRMNSADWSIVVSTPGPADSGCAWLDTLANACDIVQIELTHGPTGLVHLMTVPRKRFDDSLIDGMKRKSLAHLDENSRHNITWK